MMGFKENLKSELNYTGMMVKELSAITGIRRHTLDNYLNTHNSIPNAVAAVKIANALGVSVEYLITGKDSYSGEKNISSSKELRSLIDVWNGLNKNNRKLALSLLKILEETEKTATA